MGIEFPFGTIHQLQISLRKGTNIPSYDPTDASLPGIPSVEDSISRLDPSPPYLRCKHCKGSLLRGINSLFCVFCGREQLTEATPDPINFQSTTGYKWLLESLQLDGSEIVELTSEVNESSRSQNTPKQQPLSDLLNLEIAWHPKSEQARTYAKESPSLNLAGVDLDDFFVEAKTEINFKQPEEQTRTLDNNVFQGHQDLSLFQSSQPSVAPASSTPVETDSWETKFQSFGSGKESSENESKWSTKPTSYSDADADDWFQDDPRSNPITTTNNSSANMGWFQNNQWQNSSNNLHTTNDNDDDWEDFASSITVKDQGIPSVQNSGMDLFSVSVQEKDGGDFQQPDLFSGAFQSQIDPPNTNLQSSDSERAIGEGMLNEGSSKSEVEMLISQMHDLSFMLDSNISIPRPTGKT